MVIPEFLTIENKMYENKIIKSGYVKWKELIPFQNENFKEMSKDEFAKLEKSFTKNGSLMAWTIWESGNKKYLLDGVGRKLLYEEKEKQGLKPPDKVYCNYLDLKNKKEAAKAVLILSSQYRRITKEGLLEFTTLNDLYSELPELSAEIDLANFDMPNYLGSNYELPTTIEEKLKLADRFLVPPFSVFDTKQGYWQDRKRAWINLGIKSELGRGGGFDTVQPDLQRSSRLVSGGGKHSEQSRQIRDNSLSDQENTQKRLTWNIDMKGQSYNKKGYGKKYGEVCKSI
jgi:hypothetical protein